MSSGSGTPIRVLLVDDHPVVRRGLARILATAGDIEVVAEAGTGRAALDLLGRHRPAVVALDLMLPDIDGAALIRGLLRIDPRVRVLVLSSFGSETDVRRAAEAGAIGYLLKDAEDEELIQAVRRAAQGVPAFTPATTAPLLHAMQRDRLTSRELEVVQLIVEGLEDEKMAARLGVSPSTVKTHVSNAFRKLDVRDRGQLVVTALRQGLVRVPGRS